MTDQKPELHRFGKRTLMRLGAIQPEGAPGTKGVTQVWRDVTLQVTLRERQVQAPPRQAGGRAPPPTGAAEGRVMAIVVVGAAGAALLTLAAVSLGLLVRLWEL